MKNYFENTHFTEFLGIQANGTLVAYNKTNFCVDQIRDAQNEVCQSFLSRVGCGFSVIVEYDLRNEDITIFKIIINTIYFIT